MNSTTVASRWERYQGDRAVFLDRAINCSSLTIPHLIPESDRSSTPSHQQLDSLYQALGARGVNNLAAKLLLALYPPSQPFFRLTLDKRLLAKFMEEQGQQGGDVDGMAAGIDEGLAQLERSILLRLDKMAMRATLFEALKHLLVGGNGLLYVGDTVAKFHGLRSFCIARDPEGNWCEIVVKEEVADEFLPPGAIDESKSGRRGYEPDTSKDYTDVYTYVKQEGGQVKWYQECRGKKIGKTSMAPVEKSPWIPLRLHRVAGENYGRGLVEEVLGDLRSYESLAQATVEAALITARSIILVNPNGVTRSDTLAKAANGAVITGSEADVAMLGLDKSRDMAVAQQRMDVIERQLVSVFMLYEARQAERVTAEEVRQNAEQLEQTLGGIYSVLAQEMQQPLIKRVVALMERSGEIDPLPEAFVSPEITTGLDAIGRGNDRARLTTFVQTISATLGPEALVRYMNATELMTRFAAADGIDTKGLIRSEEELAAEAAQAQEAQVAQQLAASGGMIEAPPTA